MNAVAAALHPSMPAELFDEARRRVNEWRGRCLDALVRAEAAVTESLLVMAEHPNRGDKVSLPHLVGQRYAALATVVSDGGAFAAEGALVAVLLDQFREYDALRTALCHGIGRVTLDQNGRWTLLLEVVSLKARRPSRSIFPINEDKAQDLRKKLVRSSQILCTQLGNLRMHVLAQAAR